MDGQCGMCGDAITAYAQAAMGAVCKPCQDYTMGYIHPEPVMAPTQEALDKLKARQNWTTCSDYERWTKQRTTNTKKQRVERRKHDRP